jgi:uncharacterized membrane protein
MSPTRRGLFGVVVAAAVFGVAVLMPAPVPLRVVFALPLVLFLPGYALLWALFARATLDHAVVLLFSVALSLAVAIIGGFALQWAFPLERLTWGAFLAGVAVVAGGVAALRHEASADRPPFRLPKVRALHVVLLALAFVVAAAAIALARMPLPARGVKGYTVLWMLPAKDGSHGVDIGVISNELQRSAYRLEIEEHGRTAATETIALTPGKAGRRAFPLRRPSGVSVRCSTGRSRRTRSTGV